MKAVAQRQGCLDGVPGRPNGADSRAFVHTAELATTINIDLATLSSQLIHLGSRSKRHRIPTKDGTFRQVCGYLIGPPWMSTLLIGTEGDNADRNVRHLGLSGHGELVAINGLLIRLADAVEGSDP